MAECRQKRNAHVAPIWRHSGEVRKVIKDLDDAQLRLEAALISWRLCLEAMVQSR